MAPILRMGQIGVRSHWALSAAIFIREISAIRG
jgi:hypothetical protein